MNGPCVTYKRLKRTEAYESTRLACVGGVETNVG